MTLAAQTALLESIGRAVGHYPPGAGVAGAVETMGLGGLLGTAALGERKS